MNSARATALQNEIESLETWNTQTEAILLENEKPNKQDLPDQGKQKSTKIFGGWDVLDPLLKQRILSNNQLPHKERHSIINVLKQFALEHSKSTRSVQARYYQVLKKELEGARETVEVLSKPEETVQMLPCNYPKLGEIINARIVNLIDYGVFLETDTGYTGFLRMGDVTSDEWLSGRSDLERYFYQGEQIKAKVIKVAEDKLYFSTKAIGGKKPHSLHTVKANVEINHNAIKVMKGSTAEAELNELEKLVSLRVGPVSGACKNISSELLLTYGPVRVTAKIMEVFTGFDQGFWLMRQVKEELDGEFNRLN